MEKITLDHPESQSLDLVAQHIKQLSQLFPEVIKEGKVDFEALQDLLGNYIDTPEERFQLNWAGKAQARREAQKRSTGTLRPCPEESVDWDTTENLYIEGDNLEVLKLLQKSYNKKVKMIYIDPPYNTGNDFVYKDNYSDNLSNYLELSGQDRSLGTNTESDGRYHSNWLNMMYPRLKLARNLLTIDGVIFISIDDNEVSSLLKICDEIFGEDNFIGQWNWYKSATPPNLSKKIKKNIEYILCYQSSSNNENFKGVKKESPSDDPLTKPQNTIKELTFPAFSLQTTLSNGTYKADTYGTEKYPNILLNDLIIDNGTNLNTVTFKNKFVWTQQKLNEELINKTKISLSKSLVLSYKKADYGEEVPPNLIDENVNVSTTENAGNELIKLFDGVKVFDYPKPVSLIKYLSNFLVNNNDFILDFFSGSATTAHAVMQLNSEDGGNRKFIMVQLPEATPEDSEARKAGYKAIAEIGKERIRRAGKKILEELKAKQAAEGALFAEEQKKLDIGFKVFKLDSSNINTWDSSPSNLEGALYNSVQNIKSDRTEHDLLYEILLKYGIDLVQPINEHTLAGKKVYEMGAGALIVCMADHVKPEVAEAIAKLWKEVKPTAIDESSKAAINCRVVFKDNGFGDNKDKTNVLQILKQHGIDNVVTV